MRNIFVMIAILFASTFAHAGFQGYAADVSLDIFNKINCSTGLTCSKVGDKFTVASSGIGVLRNQVAVTATTITSAQCGSTFISGSVVEVELPEASTVLGCRLTFIIGTAQALTIDPDVGDIIALLTNAAGDSLVADAIGESVTIEAINASTWAPVGAVQGTWTDSD